MNLLDVNVLINAMRPDAPSYAIARAAITECATGSTPLGVLDDTLAALVRITTHPALGGGRLTAAQALDFCDALRQAPTYIRAVPGPGAWTRFAALVRSGGLSGNDIPDAWLAAAAITLDATLVTFDRGFEAFPGVRVRLLVA